MKLFWQYCTGTGSYQYPCSVHLSVYNAEARRLLDVHIDELQGGRLCQSEQVNPLDCRQPTGADMARRITAMVNEVIAEEGISGPLSVEDVLLLIDSGASQGGSEVCCLLGTVRTATAVVHPALKRLALCAPC
jgi:hypothetical protein